MKIELIENPDKKTQDEVLDPLIEYNRQHVGLSGKIELSFQMRDANGVLVGGANGFTHWNYFFLAHLYVNGSYRGQGIGEKVLRAVEAEAMARGCDHLWLDTFSFQAPGFYEKMGYTRIGQLPDYPHGHQRFFYTRKLK